jgi:two-component system, LuxR family, response regulator FixJ
MTIALIEDDEAALHSLTLLLQQQGMATRSFGSVEDFLAAQDFVPACIVSDVRLPGRTGLDLQRELKQQRRSTPLILITGHGDIAMAVTAIKHGAFDFIEKPYNADRLIETIGKALRAGERLRFREDQKAQVLARIAELSPRQREVMYLVADGLSNKQIAFHLGISQRTVENYRAWVMERVGAVNVADLVRRVLLVQNNNS